MAKRKLLTENDIKGMICTCQICGSKFIDITATNNLICPRCIEETVARHKDELAKKCITLPNSILGNKPIISFDCPVKVPKKSPAGETKYNDDIIPQMEAMKYATAHLTGSFVKNDSGKLQWSLLPFRELEDVVKVLMHGAKKYTPDNWKKCDDINRYKDALMRHVVAYIEGQEIDSVSSGGDDLPHLAHAICNCLFLMWFDNHKDEKRND